MNEATKVESINRKINPLPMTIRELKSISEDDARKLFEATMWPHGPVCPFCGNCSPKRIAKITPNKAKRIREGLYLCKDCTGPTGKKIRRQFTCTTNTVFHGSKISLAKWLYIIAEMSSAKAGTATRQLHREVNEARSLPDGSIGYGHITCLWHATMRVRKAMHEEPVQNALKGVLHCDEAYIGGKPRKTRMNRENRTDKLPVAVLVERDGTKAYSRVMPNVTKANLFQHIKSVADPASTIMTDELGSYMGIGEHFDGGHYSVKHIAGEYAKREDGLTVSNNSAEGYIATLKRSIYGVHYHYSKVHAQRYISERDFMYSHRNESEVERVKLILKGAVGKRLTYRAPKGLRQGGLLGGPSTAQEGQGPQVA